MDRFGRDVPAFNIGGERKVNTTVGGALTFTLLCLILAFAAVKLQQLVEKQYPFVQESTVPEHFDASDKLDLKEASYRIAFSFEGADDDTLKDDPRYVKLMVRNRTKIN